MHTDVYQSACYKLWVGSIATLTVWSLLMVMSWIYRSHRWHQVTELTGTASLRTTGGETDATILCVLYFSFPLHELIIWDPQSMSLIVIWELGSNVLQQVTKRIAFVFFKIYETSIFQCPIISLCLTHQNLQNVHSNYFTSCTRFLQLHSYLLLHKIVPQVIYFGHFSVCLLMPFCPDCKIDSMWSQIWKRGILVKNVFRIPVAMTKF